MSSADILMSFGNLLQWIAPIDDRFQLPRFDELLEEEEVASFFAGRRLDGEIRSVFLE
jgi:hypothetical protein